MVSARFRLVETAVLHLRAGLAHEFFRANTDQTDLPAPGVLALVEERQQQIVRERLERVLA